MVVAGCDIGSLTAKSVILSQGNILAAKVIKARSRPAESARDVMDMALSEANLTMKDVSCCVGTGYGRKQIDFVDDVKSEISCHAKGANYFLPTVKTVIDIGGQDCKIIRVDMNGKVVKFNTNDKCAAGTGRFLEVMADVLALSLEEMGKNPTKAKHVEPLASTCTVWAQAEVIRHVNDGKPVHEIIASINQAMAYRVAVLVNAAGVEKDVCMTGGVSKNVGVMKSLQDKIGVKIKKTRMDPQLIGAFGAAVFAGEKTMEG